MTRTLAPPGRRSGPRITEGRRDASAAATAPVIVRKEPTTPNGERRSLPGHMRDLIVDGAPKADLRARGERAVAAALRATAASALQRGWVFHEWAGDLDVATSRLGAQARTDRGRRELNRRAYERRLRTAWRSAEQWVREQPPPVDASTFRARAQEARAALDVLPDSAWPLGGAELAVLRYALDIAAKRGTSRPSLPWRDVVAATGLPERTAKTALRRLGDAELLPVAQRGKACEDEARRRATTYNVPAAEVIAALAAPATRVPTPASRASGTPAASSGTPAAPRTGTSFMTTGTPASTPADRPASPNSPTAPEALPMITVSRDPDGRVVLTAPPETLERAVAAMRDGGQVEVVEAQPGAADDGAAVVQLDRRRRTGAGRSS